MSGVFCFFLTPDIPFRFAPHGSVTNQNNPTPNFFLSITEISDQTAVSSDPSRIPPGSFPEERGLSQPPALAFPSPPSPPSPRSPLPTSVSNFLAAPWISGWISRSGELCLGFFPDYEYSEWLGWPLGVDAWRGGRCKATNCHGIWAGRGSKSRDPAPDSGWCQVSFLLQGLSRF